MSGTTSVFDQPLNGDINDVAEGLVILIDGDTAPRAITSGQYLFIKNHSTLATGGYHATAAIASGASITSSNVAVDANGIVNALNEKVSALNSKIATDWNNISSWCASIESGAATYIQKFGRMRTISFQGVARSHTEDELLMTIPQGDRPLSAIFVSSNVGGTSVVVRINSEDGNVTLYTANNAGSGRIYFSASYVCAG